MFASLLLVKLISSKWNPMWCWSFRFGGIFRSFMVYSPENVHSLRTNCRKLYLAIHNLDTYNVFMNIDTNASKMLPSVTMGNGV